MDKNKPDLQLTQVTVNDSPAAKTAISADRFHEKTRVTFLSTPTKSDGESERVLAIGDKIKQRFVLDKLLGEGGMGAVYRALDIRKHEAGDPQPYVAIKILGDSFRHHPRALITLQREAKKTQQLAHPNIVTVYDFDRDDDLIYLTMEELKGQSLSDYLKDKEKIANLGFREKSAMILQIAQALAYAHSKGLVHSDLKPANVFVTDDNNIKVLDFGIARAANQDAYQDNFDAGELGAITFNYASLEMLNYEPPHPSDDVYALGLIACQILGGPHPYAGKDANLALEKKITPHIPKLNNILLRRLLINSVALRRCDRVHDAKSFVSGFYYAIKAPRRFLTGLVLIAILGLTNYFYVKSIEVEEIPFDSLSQDDQRKFSQFVSEGNRALTLGDLEGAAFNANQAYLIHQTHSDVEHLKSNIVDIIENNIDDAKDESESAFFAKQMQALKEYPAFADKKNN
jgi:serine/threonine protein kinase